MPVLNADPPRGAYNFEDAAALPTADGLRNAQNFAFLGLLAVLNDRKFRLYSRAGDARQGKITYDKNMAPRRKEVEGAHGTQGMQGAQGAQVTQGGGGGGGRAQPSGRSVEWKGRAEWRGAMPRGQRWRP